MRDDQTLGTQISLLRQSVRKFNALTGSRLQVRERNTPDETLLTLRGRDSLGGRVKVGGTPRFLEDMLMRMYTDIREERSRQ